MKGLLLRLSKVDSDAEAAVRVIAYFDGLVEHRATPVELARSAAALAECTVGLDLPGSAAIRMRADGTRADGSAAASGSVALGSDGGRVWLERDGGPGPLDDLVLERLAMSARLLARAPRMPAPDLADPALVELALSGREEPEDRARALRLLGLVADLLVRVVAVAVDGAEPGAGAVALVTRGDRCATCASR